MKQFLYLISITFFTVLLTVKCENEGPLKRDWPGIITLEVTDITSHGAVFNARIVSSGDYKILAFGFVWTEWENPTLYNSERVFMSGELDDDKFSTSISTTLKQGKTYTVKAFVKTDNYTVYGDEVTFKSLGSQGPVITSFSPTTGKEGDTLRISGAHFSYLNPNNIITVGATKVQAIQSTDSLIITTVPAVQNTEAVEISVSVSGNKTVAASKFYYLKPVITGISPATGTFDDIITIKGSEFSPLAESNLVRFNDFPAQVINASPSSLTVKVPREIRESRNIVTVSVNQLLSNTDITFSIKAPVVDSYSAVTGFTGDVILIRGDNFNPMMAADSIFFDGNAGVIQSASKNTISVKVPAGIYNTRFLRIEVRVAGLSALGNEFFTLKNPWIRKADVPHQTPRSYATSFAINGFGYVGLGYGFTGSNFWKFDPQNNKWSQIAPFPGNNNRERAAGFVINNKAYVGLGGINLRDFWCYDPVNNRWTGIADFPAPNIRVVSLSLNNKGYVITGEQNANFWEYDAVSNSWTQKKDFPLSSSMYPFYPDAGFTLNDKIYIYATDRSTANDQLWEYNFTTDNWTRKADIAGSWLDYYTTGFTFNGKGYIRGNKYLYEYDQASDSWIQLSQDRNVPGLFSFRRSSVAFIINNLLYFGTSDSGWDNGDYTYDMWEYDPDY